jgi:Fic family protein
MAHSWTQQDPRSSTTRRPRSNDTSRLNERPRTLATKLIVRELLDARTPLSERELVEATLLPEETVERALRELERGGLCTPCTGTDPRYDLTAGR